MIYKRMYKIVRPYRKYIYLAMVSSIAAIVFNLAIPQLIRVVIDDVIAKGQIEILGFIALAVVGLTLVKGFFTFLQRYLMEIMAQKVIFDVRNLYYDKLQSLSFSYYDKTRTGQLMSRGTSDVETMKSFLSFGLIQLVQGFFSMTGVLIVMFYMSWTLTLTLLLIFPWLIFVIIKFGKLVGPAYRNIQEETASLTSTLQESISGIRVVKAFGGEEIEKKKFDENNNLVYQRNIDVIKIWNFYFPYLAFISTLGTAVIIWFGGRQVISGQMLLGELIAFNTYLILMVMPIRMLGWVVNLGQRARSSVQRIFEILDNETGVKEDPEAVSLKAVKGSITFEDISFSYDEKRPVLTDVTLDIKAGEKVAIVGMTGSGKSSLVNLIPRFYDPDKGQIFLDGQDISKFTIESLRSKIGIVPQEPFLFSTTLGENIAYGKRQASKEEIEDAAKKARIHDFISSLAQGYDTVIGERGVTLSGGQKQRVSIARALLLDPSILIMDDFVSSVDSKTEFLIAEALKVLKKGRTIIVIAQRISTLADVDMIVVMDKGKIIDQGNHQELLDRCLVYHKIFQQQVDRRMAQ